MARPLRCMLVRFRSRLAALICLLWLIVLPACSSNAGILSSGSWQKTGLQHQHIHVLAVNSNDSSTLYAGNAQGHVFLSTNAAQNWTEHSMGLPQSAALHELVFNASLKKLYAATDRGIFVSNDTVARWTLLSSSGSVLPVDSYTSLDFDASEPGHLYAGTMHHGVFASNDGGTTWFSASNGLPLGTAINSIVFDADQHRLWVATSLGVYRSTNGGQSWNAFNNGLPAGIVAYVVQTVSGTPSLVYLGTNRGFYSSRNAGASWTAAKEHLAGTGIHQILQDFRTSSSGTTLYIATDAGIFRSDDSGQNWISVGSGLPRSQPVYALAFGADNYSQVYAAADDLYQFPGTGSGLSPSRFIAIVIIFFFFFTLYRMTLRNRKRNRPTPFPKSASQTPSESSPPS